MAPRAPLVHGLRALAFAVVSLAAASAACARPRITVQGTEPFEGFRERAAREETHPLDLASGDLLEITSPSGRIHVEAAAGVAASVTVALSVYGPTEEKAKGVLDEFEIRVDRTGDGFAISVTGDPVPVATEDADFLLQPGIDIHATVPEGTRLAARSIAGNVTAEGPLGSCEIEEDYGKVSLARVEGDVSVLAGSGSVQLHAVRGGTVRVAANFGAVELQDVRGDDIRAESKSGAITAAGLEAEKILLRSGFGSLRIVGAEGTLGAETLSGDIHVTNPSAGDLRLHSGYGNVTVQGGGGSLVAKSAGGKVSVTSFTGRVAAIAGFGAVEVDAVLEGLEAVSESGSVSVLARPGSRVAAEWSLSSSFGSVALSAPPDLSCRLEAKTDLGVVEVTGYSLVPESGGPGAKKVEGTIGTGGMALRLSSSSGNVSLSRLDGEG